MDLNPDGGTYKASGNVRVSVANSEKPARYISDKVLKELGCI